MRALIGLICGFIFGIGLIIAQMTNPKKVLDFLDILDGWDPSLALVMGGGLVVFGVGFYFLNGRPRSLLGMPVVIPPSRTLDTPLFVGAALFGLGWGLVGLCPGPAIAALTIGGTDALIFVAAMVVGMLLHNAYSSRRTR